MRKNILFLIHFLLLNLTISAQVQYFSHYSVDDGLSQSVVNCIYQDSKGFIWIGTQNGLNRFDGYTFKEYIRSSVDTISISDNWIFKIVEDNNSNLWIGTKGGLNKYNRETDNFSRIKYANIYIEDIYLRVYGLALDNKNGLYINTPPKLSYYNIDNVTVELFGSNLEYDAGDKNSPLPIIIDKHENVWIASTRGLSRFDSKIKKFQYFKSGNENNFQISKDSVNCIFEDADGKIWIGTTFGLNCYDYSTSTFIKYFNDPDNANSLSNNLINCITQDDNGNFWIGTDNGLNKMTLENNGEYSVQRFTSQNDGLSHDVILELFIDYSKNLWIGTLQGIDKTDLKPKKFKLYQKNDLPQSIDLLDNIVASLYKDENGDVWVGNWGKGLNILNRKTNTVIHYSSELNGNNYISNDYIHVIFEDNLNRVFIGTRSGFFVFDKINKKFIPLQDFFNSKSIPSFENIRVNSITQDKDFNYWFGTQNGLYKINLQNFTSEIYNTESELKICWNYIYELLIDSEQILWIATSNGLDAFDLNTNSIKHFINDRNDENSLCDNFVVSLCEDYEGNIWVGTNTGVNKYVKNANKFIYYYKDNGLPSNLIYEIIEDANKNLWFATGAGLGLFDRNTETFRTFSMEEGLQSTEFNLGGAYKSKDEEVFLGGMKGFNSFYPDSLTDNNYIPSIVFTNFEKYIGSAKVNVKIDNVNLLILNYDENIFTIEFSSLEFTNPVNNKYAYKMFETGKEEGEWIDIATRQFVPFTNLPPGKYTFKVKGTNNDGIWNEEGISLEIRIKPPWWKSNLALVCYIILVIILIFGVIKIREQNHIKERNILEIKVKERTEEINNQKEKIEKAHEEITDSINYASRIQTALLPNIKTLEEYFSDHFVLYKPKNVVSGDFYWAKKVKEYIVFAVADCTGHGVPGAFVSMLGITLLNEVIRKEEITQSCQVLNELRNQIKIALNQHNYEAETKDGMDIGFCIYNTTSNLLDYSGANIPLLLIKKDTTEIIEYKPSKNPIGIYYKEKSFESTFIEISKGDKIYLFSDGYCDQFNETNREKYKLNRLKISLSNNCHLPFYEQKVQLENNFQNWKGAFNQIDDILVFGIEF